MVSKGFAFELDLEYLNRFKCLPAIIVFRTRFERKHLTHSKKDIHVLATECVPVRIFDSATEATMGDTNDRVGMFIVDCNCNDGLLSKRSDRRDGETSSSLPLVVVLSNDGLDRYALMAPDAVPGRRLIRRLGSSNTCDKGRGNCEGIASRTLLFDERKT
jgi:hypothetical protein